MAASLLKQLLSHLPVLPPDIERLYQSCTENGMGQKPALAALVSSFISCTSQFASVYLLIDAFDECDYEYQEELILLINSFSAVQNLRLLLTSRPSVHRLREIIVPESIIIIQADPKDVEAYLAARLGKQPFLSHQIKVEIATRLAMGIKGM